MTKQKKILILILSGMLVKLVILMTFSIIPQTFENTTIAQNFLADGQMYYLLDGNADYNHQFPFYGWILIFFFKLFGVVLLPVQIFQVLLNGVFAWVVWKLFANQFKTLASKSWSGIALVSIALFHPLLSYYQLGTIHPITMDVLLFALLMYVGLLWRNSSTVKMSLLLVLVLGAALLERSTLAVAILPAFILALKDKILLFKLMGISSIAILFFAVPWMVRNHSLTEKYQMTSGTWRYMWVGIQEETDGTNVLANGESYYALFPQEIKDKWSSMDLQEQMSFYKTSYLSTWNENPSLLLTMWGVKLKNMFWFSEHAGGKYQNETWFVVFKSSKAVLLLLFILGCFSSKRKELLLLLSAGLALSLVQSFFYVETRHAFPFHFILWIGALLGVDLLISRIKKRIE